MLYLCMRKREEFSSLDYGRVPYNCKRDHGADCVNVVYE